MVSVTLCQVPNTTNVYPLWCLPAFQRQPGRGIVNTCPFSLTMPCCVTETEQSVKVELTAARNLFIILRLLNEQGWSSLCWTWARYQIIVLNLVLWWLQLAATCFPEVSVTPCTALHLHFFFFLSVDYQKSLLVLQQILAIVYFRFSHPSIDLSLSATCRYLTSGEIAQWC